MEITTITNANSAIISFMEGSLQEKFILKKQILENIGAEYAPTLARNIYCRNVAVRAPASTNCENGSRSSLRRVPDLTTSSPNRRGYAVGRLPLQVRRAVPAADLNRGGDQRQKSLKRVGLSAV
jgi:hypothetical protein